MGQGLEFLSEIMVGGLANVAWPFVRISSFFMAFFAVGGQGTPMRVRLLLSLTMTLCVLPMIPAVPPQMQLFSVPGVMTTCTQVIIGAGIGLMTQYLAQIFVLAGQAVAMQTGLGFASLVDPVSGSNTPVVGQFFSVLTTLFFFAIDGHLIFIRLLLESFTTLPVGPTCFSPANLSIFLNLGAFIFEGAVAIAISAICTMLVINFTLGVMTRAAPQLNVFSLGFAISLCTGIFVVMIILTSYPSNFVNDFNHIFEQTCTLIGTSCEGPL